MKVIFHWHAFVEIENNDFSILIDPYIIWNTYTDVNLDEICSKNIKAICVSHGHLDHLWNTVDIVNKTWAKVISTFELVTYLAKFYNISSSHSMHIWWTYDFWDYKVKFVNAIHWWAIWEEFFPWKAAWIILQVNWIKVYHTWDTALTYDMKLLESENIDLMFVPIWDNFTMGIEDAVKAVEFIKPKMVVPMHYNTFDVIKQDPEIFINKINMWNISLWKILKSWEFIEYR